MATVSQSEDTSDQIVAWLNAGQEKALKRYLPTTCEWIAQEVQYKQWEAQMSSFSALWIHGPAGTTTDSLNKDSLLNG
jgi:hypothetical protein